MTGDNNHDANTSGERKLKPAPPARGVQPDSSRQEHPLPEAPAIPSNSDEKPIASAPAVPGSSQERHLAGPSGLPNGGPTAERQVRPAPAVPTSNRRETPLPGPTPGPGESGSGEKPVQAADNPQTGTNSGAPPAAPVNQSGPNAPVPQIGQPIGSPADRNQWQAAAAANPSPQSHQNTMFGQGVATPNQGQTTAPTGQPGNVFGPQGYVGNPPSAPPPVPPPSSDGISSPSARTAAHPPTQSRSAGPAPKKIRPGSKARQIRRQAKAQTSYFALMFLFGAAFFLVVVVLIMIVALAT